MMQTQSYRQGWIHFRQESDWPNEEIRAVVGCREYATNNVAAAKRWIRKVEALPVADFFKLPRCTTAKGYRPGPSSRRAAHS